jgi:hypothetical protein
MRLKNHTFVGGITGSGKTEYGMHLFENADKYRIFLNTNEEPKVESLGYATKDVEELIDLLKQDKKKLIYNPPFKGDNLKLLKETLFAIGKIMAGKRRRIWCYLFIDEIHLLAGKMQQSVIEDFFTRGKRYGIVCVAMAQRPALVSQTVLTQCYYHILFECGRWEEPYFKNYKIPIEEIKDHLEKPYHYCIVSPNQIWYKAPIEPVR